MSCSENYRQLQLLRGMRAVEETEEDRAERAMTRSEAKVEQYLFSRDKIRLFVFAGVVQSRWY